MLAVVIQSSFVFAVAVVNLLLGFALGRGLGFGYPFLATRLAAGSRSSETPPESSLASVANKQPAQETLPTKPAEPAASDKPADNDEPATIDETAAQLATTLEARIVCLETIKQDLAESGDSATPASAESASSQIDAQTQQILQSINRASDRLGQLAQESPQDSGLCESTSQLLEDSWGQLNDALVQLVVLTFDEKTLGDTVGQLIATIEAITTGCRAVHQQLDESTGASIGASPSEQGTTT